MSSTAYQHPVQSDSSTQFRELLQTNESSATVNLVLPSRDPLWYIRAISIIATQNLAYELMLFTKATNLGGTIATDYFLGTWQFTPLVVGPPASPGWPIDPHGTSPGDSLYHFYVDGNMLPYYDLDQLNAASAVSGGTYPNNASLHCRLINRSAAAKFAGNPGALQVTFFVAAQGQHV